MTPIYEITFAPFERDLKLILLTSSAGYVIRLVDKGEILDEDYIGIITYFSAIAEIRKQHHWIMRELERDELCLC